MYRLGYEEGDEVRRVIDGGSYHGVSPYESQFNRRRSRGAH